MSQIIPKFAVGCILAAGLVTAGLARAAQFDSTDAPWLPLFDGKSLDGWTAKITGHPLGADPARTFRTDRGLLKVRYDRYEKFAGQFGHLFYASPFTHYALHVEYRFVGGQLDGGPGWAARNSGVMLHAQAPATMAVEQDFPISIEAQFLGGLSDGNARPTGNVCTPGTDISVAGERYPQHCLPSGSATYDGDQWVNVTIVVLGGGRITHYVEGEEVLSYERPRLDEAAARSRPGETALAGGYIALQSESHPVDFRQVRLLNLAGCMDPQASNHAPYFVKSEPESCVY